MITSKKKYLKIFTINVLLILFFISFVEIFFGYWFDKNNLGPYMREHRMKKNLYTLKTSEQTYNFTYKRNYYGFRGDDIRPDDIKIILIGGSTADERYKPEEFTITGFLNESLKNNNFNLKIINAGIEGQSTRGHIINFKHWFPKLKNFSPNYVIFYIGINDALLNLNDNIIDESLSDGWVKNPSKIESFNDNFKSSSIFYDLLRKTKHKYYSGNEQKRIVYDLDYALKENNSIPKFEYLSYNEKLKLYNLNKLKKLNEQKIKYYLNNIDKLSNYTKSLGAIPIFINQEMSQHTKSEILFTMNISLIEHCKDKSYNCIDLAKNLVSKSKYFWDGIHTTPLGSKKIAEIIFPELTKFLKK
jgi:lysophospholipase L1-like esterase